MGTGASAYSRSTELSLATSALCLMVERRPGRRRASSSKIAEAPFQRVARKAHTLSALIVFRPKLDFEEAALFRTDRVVRLFGREVIVRALRRKAQGDSRKPLGLAGLMAARLQRQCDYHQCRSASH